MLDLAQKSVLVLGLGRFGGGVGVTRFLVNQGAKVRVSDAQSKADLADSINQLQGLPIEYCLGGHQANHLEGIDLVVVNPAIKPNHPFIQEIEKLNIPQTTEINLFFERCLGKIIAVIGTNGKETVVRMTFEILKKKTPSLFMGGNIGYSLLNDLNKITPESLIVLELSSFQLHRLKMIRRRPDVAVYVNIQPDHEDWHGSFNQYLEDKLVALSGQGNQSAAIINIDDQNLKKVTNRAEGRLIETSLRPLSQGVYFKDDMIMAKDNEGERILSSSKLKVPGQHNISNALLASAVGYYFSLGQSDIEPTITSFKGIEHVLEYVDSVSGVDYYNDSAATNPQASLVALDSFNKPIWLIAGGYDKKIDYSPYVAAMTQKVKGVAVIGDITQKLSEMIKAQSPSLLVFEAQTLSKAFEWVAPKASNNEIVLLSPGTSSYDQFLNLEERGEVFKSLVRGLKHVA